MSKTGFVYMLTNYTNKVLYTGVTSDLIRRVKQHKRLSADGFTKKYNVTKLVYFEEYGKIMDAIEREKQIKGWVRRKKDELVNGMNPEWGDLYSGIQR